MQEYKVRRLIAQHDAGGQAHFVIDEVVDLPPFGPNALADL